MTPLNAGAGHEYPFYKAFIITIFEEKGYDSYEAAFEYIESTSSRYYLDFLSKKDTPLIDIAPEELKSELIEDVSVSAEKKKSFAAKCEVLEEVKRI